MRRSPSPLFSLLPFLFFLFFLFLLPCSEAKKKSKTKSEGEEGRTSTSASTSTAVLASGELSTREGHRCTWEVREGRNNNNNALLQLSCVGASDGAEPAPTYGCQFSGKPQECPAYVAKPSQYWKQVIGRLKKRTNACEGEKVLKTRICKKAPAAAHMKLADRKGEKKGERDKGKAEEKKEEEKKKEKEVVEDEEAMQGDGEANDEEQSYCREGWNSVCRFFVKLLDG